MKQGRGLQSKKQGLVGGGALSTTSTLGSKSGFKGTSTKIKSKSTKQSKIDSELHKVYEEMDKGDNIHCTGCGRADMLEHSHLIPRSKRQDLIAEPENITYHCNECHLIWEHGTLKEMSTLDDFNKNMEYIKKVDSKYYQLLMLNR